MKPKTKRKRKPQKWLPFDGILDMTAKPPTPVEVIAQLSAFGLECGALVQKPDDQTIVGFMVAMLSDAAVRHIGPLLIEAAHREELGRPDTGSFTDNHETVLHIFNKMQEEKVFFLWGGGIKEYGAVTCFVMGDEACRWLAPRLTLAGCPTAID